MKRELLGLAMCASVAAGCAETVPQRSVEAEDIYKSGHVVQVQLGESNFIKVVDPGSDEGKDLVRNLHIVDEQKSNGPNDGQAPTVTNTPIRMNVQVELHGDYPKLSNDAACNTVKVEGQPKYVGAIALGGQEHGVMITRPLDNPGFMYVCSFQKMEPADNKGVVIFSSDKDR